MIFLKTFHCFLFHLWFYFVLVFFWKLIFRISGSPLEILKQLSKLKDWTMQIYREINAYRTCNYRSLTEHNICSNRRNSKASGVASRTGNQLIDQSSFPFKGFSAYTKQFSIVQLVQYRTVIGSLLELFLLIMTFLIVY